MTSRRRRILRTMIVCLLLCVFIEGAAALTITANKESVVHGNYFVVTVTGEPQTVYSLYVNDAGLASEDQYPLIAPGQPGVVTNTGVFADAAAEFPYTRANLTTTAAGTRTVQFNTSSATELRSFTITVVDPADQTVSDTVTVAVTRGKVSVTASGTGLYYVGEEITLSGTNTENTTTFLLFTGPDLPAGGARLDEGAAAVVDGDGSTFTQVGVANDGTWEYVWNTSRVSRALKSGIPGTYTVYALSPPRDKAHLSDAAYGSYSIVLKPPLTYVKPGSNIIARGDDLTISGYVDYDQQNVYVWIFADGCWVLGSSAAVTEPWCSFTYVLPGADTRKMTSGECYVVVQNPGGDRRPDVTPISDTRIRDAGGNEVDLGLRTLPDAANTLVNALNAPEADDTYARLTLPVEEPRIGIDAVGDRGAGSTFTLTGTTNLAAGDELSVNVTNASSASLFRGQAVVQYAYATLNNTWSLPIDTTGFAEGEYTVTVGYPALETEQTATFTLVPPGLVVSAPTASPAVIVQNTDGTPVWGETATLSVTAAGAGIASVTVDLSEIGGSPAAAMAGVGDGTWTASVSSPLPSPFSDGAYRPVLLAVNVTGADGVSDTSVAIPLTVIRNGDANQDNRVTLYDAVYMGRHVLGIGSYPMTESVGAVCGDSYHFVTFADAAYLAKHVLGVPGYEVLH